MKNYNKITTAIIIILFTIQLQAQGDWNAPTEEEERSKIYTMKDAIRDKQYVFSFNFNKSSETAMWSGIFLMLEKRFRYTDYNITLQCFSSAGESESYDKELATKRGNAVKKFLIDKGISKSRINIEVYGNKDIYGIKSEGFNGLKDYVYHRRVEPIFVLKEKKKIKDFIIDFKNAETLNDDIDEGQEIFLDLIEPYVKAIKEGNHLQKLPGVGRPSSDQDEFLEQAESLIKETVKAGTNPKKLGKLIATYGLGSFIDLFTSNQTKVIAKNRKEMYIMIIEAFTKYCFPKYPSNNRIKQGNYSSSQKYLFYVIGYEISKLSNHEKYKIRARFIAGQTPGLSTESRSHRFKYKINNPSTFKSSMSFFFAKSEYRYRD
ncbi:OmpA family protein [Lacinutrix sp. Bg11-31]|uniref:OmpA family protein n=1 Tax=Lacinutrix sp. Bg11-31 TaxID=2057808 RepID=UPI000C31B762|nr:OmpA family protein [Lacinutrix sp. Bg11-31]AUC81022.1 hypothetical protein CW733_02275 [Lacinutrix sp. Bg11-31]